MTGASDDAQLKKDEPMNAVSACVRVVVGVLCACCRGSNSIFSDTRTHPGKTFYFATP